MKRQFTSSLAVMAVAALLLFTRSAMTAQVQDKAEASLKAAMDKETLDGDLKGAIEQYKKITQSKDRSIGESARPHGGVLSETGGRRGPETLRTSPAGICGPESAGGLGPRASGRYCGSRDREG